MTKPHRFGIWICITLWFAALLFTALAASSQIPGVSEVVKIADIAREHPGQQLRAVPGEGLEVAAWILGSSTYGAQMAGRLGLPASGYLFGTYENPTNAGDGYSMALHAGAGPDPATGARQVFAHMAELPGLLAAA